MSKMSPKDYGESGSLEKPNWRTTFSSKPRILLDSKKMKMVCFPCIFNTKGVEHHPSCSRSLKVRNYKIQYPEPELDKIKYLGEIKV